MAEFRFILDPDGANTEISTPKNWDDQSVKIVRDDTIKGLFVEYVTEVEFYDDGYTEISSLLSPCGSVDIRIDIKTTQTEHWKTFFDGIIYFEDVRVNDTECTIKTRIESNTLQNIIQRNKDIQVRLDSVTTLNNNEITSIEKTCDFIDASDGSNDAQNVVAYSVDDVLQFVLSYITDNGVTLSSGFFKSDTNGVQIQTIEFDAALVTGNTITIEYIASNYLAIPTPSIVGFNTSNSQTLEDIAADLQVVNAPGYDKLHDSLNGGEFRFAQCKSNGTDTITCYSFVDITINSVTVTGGASQANATITETQARSFGMRDLALTNGYQLSGSSTNIYPKMSFAQIFTELNKCFNITFRMSGTTVVIERMEDEFGSASVATLNYVDQMKWQFDNSFVWSSISLGSGGRDVDLIENNLLQKPVEYGFGGGEACGAGGLNLQNEWITDAFIVDNVSSQTGTSLDADDSYNEDQIYLFEVANGTVSSMTEKVYEVKENFATGNPLFQPNNIFLINILKLEYNLFRIYQEDIVLADIFDVGILNTYAVYDNTSGTRINKAYNFQHPITFDQFDAIRDSLIGKILFSETNSAHTEGWIKEMEYSVRGGLTEFQLYTE